MTQYQILAFGVLGGEGAQKLDMAAAEDLVARLDERLATSPVGGAFRARQHFADAAAGVFLEGELVHLEDLVLHDAAADIRSPTHALIRAHAALRARRRIAAAAPEWAVSAAALDDLRGLAPADAAVPLPPKHEDPIQAEEDALAQELAAIDALLARTSRVLKGQGSAPASAAKELPDLIAVADKDRLAEWQSVLSGRAQKSPVIAAAQAGAALDRLAPLPNQDWLGRLLVANTLRARGKTRHHLAALNLGMKIATRERKRGRADRLAVWVEAIAAAAQAGLSEHDRLLNIHRGLQRKLVGRRSTSRLPELADMVMRSPVVSSQTIAMELKITPRAAQDLVAALGLRELTGRTRYRCWGVL